MAETSLCETCPRRCRLAQQQGFRAWLGPALSHWLRNSGRIPGFAGYPQYSERRRSSKAAHRTAEDTQPFLWCRRTTSRRIEPFASCTIRKVPSGPPANSRPNPTAPLALLREERAPAGNDSGPAGSLDRQRRDRNRRQRATPAERASDRSKTNIL